MPLTGPGLVHSFGSRTAVRLDRICGGAAEAADDSQHEPARESL
jgi:hypothetical protein